MAEAIQAFISHRLGSNEELCVKLERVETDLAVADGVETLKLVEGEKRAISVEADRLKEKREAMEAKYKRAEQENSQLRREVGKLRPGFVAQKKEMEELQAGFVA